MALKSGYAVQTLRTYDGTWHDVQIRGDAVIVTKAEAVEKLEAIRRDFVYREDTYRIVAVRVREVRLSKGHPTTQVD